MNFPQILCASLMFANVNVLVYGVEVAGGIENSTALPDKIDRLVAVINEMYGIATSNDTLEIGKFVNMTNDFADLSFAAAAAIGQMQVIDDIRYGNTTNPNANELKDPVLNATYGAVEKLYDTRRLFEDLEGRSMRINTNGIEHYTHILLEMYVVRKEYFMAINTTKYNFRMDFSGQYCNLPNIEAMILKLRGIFACNDTVVVQRRQADENSANSANTITNSDRMDEPCYLARISKKSNYDKSVLDHHSKKFYIDFLQFQFTSSICVVLTDKREETVYKHKDMFIDMGRNVNDGFSHLFATDSWPGGVQTRISNFLGTFKEKTKLEKLPKYAWAKVAVDIRRNCSRMIGLPYDCTVVIFADNRNEKHCIDCVDVKQMGVNIMVTRHSTEDAERADRGRKYVDDSKTSFSKAIADKNGVGCDDRNLARIIGVAKYKYYFNATAVVNHDDDYDKPTVVGAKGSYYFHSQNYCCKVDTYQDYMNYVSYIVF